jgi:hypothetical protein
VIADEPRQPVAALTTGASAVLVVPPLGERHAGWDIGRKLATVREPSDRVGLVQPVLNAGVVRAIVHCGDVLSA